MRETVKATEMLAFLKEEWQRAHHLLEVLGRADERAQIHADECIGMKELVEAMICAPVNLKLDGRVSIGLDEHETFI